eukprot:1743368-Amphidinium_carterae.1
MPLTNTVMASEVEHLVHLPCGLDFCAHDGWPALHEPRPSAWRPTLPANRYHISSVTQHFYVCSPHDDAPSGALHVASGPHEPSGVRTWLHSAPRGVKYLCLQGMALQLLRTALCIGCSTWAAVMLWTPMSLGPSIDCGAADVNTELRA